MPKCLPVQTSPWKLDSPNYFEINTPKMKLLTQAPLQASSSHQTFSSHEAGALIYQALTHNLWRRPCLLRLTCRIHCICASFQQHLRELCRGGYYCLLVLPRQGRLLLLLKSVLPSPVKGSYPGSSLPLLPRLQCHRLFSTQSQRRSFK